MKNTNNLIGTPEHIYHAASWHIVAELQRRHQRSFRVLEMHPGGGSGDCLSIYGYERGQVCFNRGGSLHIWERFDGGNPPDELDSDIWKRLIFTNDIRAEIDSISRSIGLSIPNKLGPSSPKTLLYRVIARWIAFGLFQTEDRRCLNGYLDTSGEGGGVREDLFDLFPAALERLRIQEEGDFLEQPAYRFWFLCYGGSPVVAFETNGSVWFRDNTSWEIKKAYNKHCKIDLLVSAIDSKQSELMDSLH